MSSEDKIQHLKYAKSTNLYVMSVVRGEITESEFLDLYAAHMPHNDGAPHILSLHEACYAHLTPTMYALIKSKGKVVVLWEQHFINHTLSNLGD